MGISFVAPGLILLLTACSLAVSETDTIVVGGSENWRYGFNYTGWSLQHGPFYINDKLGWYLITNTGLNMDIYSKNYC